MKGKPGSNVPMQPTIPKMPSNTSNALEALDSVNATQFNALDSISRQAAISAICSACGKIDCDRMDKCEKLQLPPANCSEFPNNSDTISRQAAIDALDEQIEQCDKSLSSFDISIKDEFAVKVERASLVTFRETLEYLPPAQLGTNLAEVGTDCISRQAAIKALDKRFDSIPMEQTTAILLLRRDLRELPPTNTSEFPNSSDTISRKAAIEVVQNRPMMLSKEKVLLINDLEKLPPAQPESDSGRWERHYSRPGVYADLYWHCSKCGYKTDYQYANVNHHYCPNCGRKMEREVSNE